jgi:tetratricopeptide (TPR) repeat protein
MTKIVFFPIQDLDLQPFYQNMINKIDTRIVKIAVAAGSLAWAVYLFATGHWISGIFVVLLTVLLTLIIFRSIRLVLAFFQIRQQKMEGAKKWLERTNPDHLWKSQKGYYYFLLGSVDIQKNSLAQSEKYFRRALDLGLRMDHDKAAVYLNLAVIMANKRKKREALNFLNEAKKYDTRGLMKSEIKQIGKMLASI